MLRPDKGKFRISQGYSMRHGGVDLAPSPGTKPPLYSPEDGVIYLTGNRPQLEGRFVLIKSNKYIHYLGHMDRVDVRKGQKVTEGQQVGLTGQTGKATGVHVHWEVRNLLNQRFSNDPLKVLAKETSKVASKTFVTQVYKSVLQRNPDKGGLEYYTGRPAEEVLNHIYNSDEAKAVRTREDREDRLRAEMTQTIAQLKKVNTDLSERPTKKDLELAQKANAELTQKVADLQKQLDDKPDIPPHEPIDDVEGLLTKLINWLKGVWRG